MNFLQLCKRLVQESPITGNGPASVEGQTGEMLRVVDWINTAYIDIQSLHNTWRFLQEEFSFSTVIGQQTYSPSEVGLDNLETWNVKNNDVRVYDNVADERYLVYYSWETFRPVYLYGSNRTQSEKPTIVSVKPNNDLILWGIPDKIYTIDGEYQLKPSYLIGNADTPLFPASYHMCIVWSALMMYCAYESIPDLYAQAESKYRKVVRKLEMEQLPNMGYGKPLA